MEKNSIKDYSGLICRILVGALFVASGTSKFLASHEMLVWHFSGIGLPEFAGSFLAYVLPYIEVIFGLFLMVGLYMPYPLLLFTAGLALHEIILLIAWLRGLYGVNEPYFGPFMSHSMAWEIFQNVLAILLIYPASMFGGTLTLDSFIKKTIPEKIK